MCSINEVLKKAVRKNKDLIYRERFKINRQNKDPGEIIGTWNEDD